MRVFGNAGDDMKLSNGLQSAQERLRRGPVEWRFLLTLIHRPWNLALRVIVLLHRTVDLARARLILFQP